MYFLQTRIARTVVPTCAAAAFSVLVLQGVISPVAATPNFQPNEKQQITNLLSGANLLDALLNAEGDYLPEDYVPETRVLTDEEADAADRIAIQRERIGLLKARLKAAAKKQKQAKKKLDEAKKNAALARKKAVDAWGKLQKFLKENGIEVRGFPRNFQGLHRNLQLDDVFRTNRSAMFLSLGGALEGIDGATGQTIYTQLQLVVLRSDALNKAENEAAVAEGDFDRSNQAVNEARNNLNAAQNSSNASTQGLTVSASRSGGQKLETPVLLDGTPGMISATRSEAMLPGGWRLALGSRLFWSDQSGDTRQKANGEGLSLKVTRRLKSDLQVGVTAHYRHEASRSSTTFTTLDTDVFGLGVTASLLLPHDIKLTTLAAWEHSWNDITITGFKGRFDTDSFLLSGTLSRTYALSDGWRVTPKAKLAWRTADRETYVNTAGRTIRGGTEDYGVLTFGPTFSRALPFDPGDNRLGLLRIAGALGVEGIWAFEKPRSSSLSTGTRIDFADTGLEINSGFQFSFASGMRAELGGKMRFMEGNRRSWSLNVGVNWPL